jgi:hypothetical protein
VGRVIPGWLIGIFVTAGLVGVPAVWFFHLIERRHRIYLTVLAAAIFVFCTLSVYLWNPAQPTNLVAIGAFFGSMLVTAGWIVSNEIAILNSRRQHTIAVLSAYYTNPERRKDVDVIKKKLPYPRKLTASVADFHDSDSEFNKAIDRTLGLHEFIAAAIEQRDIDERLARETISGSFVGFYLQCADYIHYWRFEAPEADRETWINICRVYNKWRGPQLPQVRTD